MDFDAIATALAARFSAAAVTPPAGYDNIRVATAYLPGVLNALPAVLVFLEGGDFSRTGGGTREGGHDWRVRFYYNQTGDIENDMSSLLKWATVLTDQLKGAAQLAGIVSFATVTGYRLGVLRYANETYSGIELAIRIGTDEAWLAVA